MSPAPEDGDPEPLIHEEQSASFAVDAREATGVQVGEHNTQINYSYTMTWTSDAVPPPLVDVSGVIESPYRGLSGFTERDAPFFFGRETTATRLLDLISRRLETAGPLVVSGVSGAGKSSLLRAGVLARIRGAGLAGCPEAASWPCLVFTPTRAPLDELAVRTASLARADAATVRRELATDPAAFVLTARQGALATAGRPADPDRPGRPRRLLFLLDQFEQVFTQCDDERQREAFIAALHAAATTAHGPDQVPAALVVLVVRADFEARCADYPELAPAVQDRYLVTSMTARQLRMAITEPARMAGSDVDEDLVGTLLDGVRSRAPRSSSAGVSTGGSFGAGVLPLLSHALDQTWRSRAGHRLTLADYERTGGIEGAVAESAQRAYDRLTAEQRTQARHVFTRLTATSADGADTADRAGRADLVQGRSQTEARDIEAALESFAAERLLTLTADSVEISHEVLLTAWPLLRDTWLAETRVDRVIRTRLRATAAEWSANAHDPSYLYKGSLLEAATGAVARIETDPARHPPLGADERGFLQASTCAVRRELRRRQAATAFLAALAIGLAAVAFLAYRSGSRATAQRDTAIANELSAQSQTLGDADPTVSALESIAAWRIRPSAETRYGMLAAASRPGIATLTGHTDWVKSVDVSPDGTTVASGGRDGTIRLWDIATHRPHGTLVLGRGWANAVVFGPDGRTLASGSADGTVRLWDLATHRQIGTPFPGYSGEVNGVALSPDGHTLASADGNGTVRFWDVAGHRRIGAPLRISDGPIAHVAFSPDGRTLASTGETDGMVRLWDVATHRQIRPSLTGHTDEVWPVAFSPDGRTLATGGLDDTVRMWDLHTHRQIGRPLTGHTNTVEGLAFAPDGRSLASCAADGTVRLWDVATHIQLGASLVGHAGTVTSVAFGPGDNTLATGGIDGVVRIWNPVVHRQVGAPFGGRDGDVHTVTFSPDGRTIATLGARTAWRWDVATRRPVGRPLSVALPAAAMAFSPDRKSVAIADPYDAVHLFDMVTGREVGAPLTGHTGTLNSLAFSPDGGALATGSDDGTVRLWDLATHRQTGPPLTGHGHGVTVVAFAPDGRTLASAGGDIAVRLWDVATHRQIDAPLTGHRGDIYAMAFSPDGRTLAVGGHDGTVWLWDVAGHHLLGAFTGNTNWVEAVTFSPDGARLATGGYDGTVRLWDVATHRQIGDALTGHGQPVNTVAFSPDGRILASGGQDDTVRMWNVDHLVDVLPWLCSLTRRSLTRAEWAHYVPAGPVYHPVCR